MRVFRESGTGTRAHQPPFPPQCAQPPELLLCEGKWVPCQSKNPIEPPRPLLHSAPRDGILCPPPSCPPGALHCACEQASPGGGFKQHSTAFSQKGGRGTGGVEALATRVWSVRKDPARLASPGTRPGMGPPAAAPTWPRPSSHSKNPTRASGATIPAVPWKAGSIFVVGSHASTKDCPNEKPTEDSSLPKKKGQRRGL